MILAILLALLFIALGYCLGRAHAYHIICRTVDEIEEQREAAKTPKNLSCADPGELDKERA